MKFFKITLFACFIIGLAFVTASGTNQMSVQVKKGHVRMTPSFLGKIVATLVYGTRVDIVEEKNAWFRIAIPGSGTTGWIHTSALSRKKIVLAAGVKNVEEAATSNELALAGKGFNKQVEGEFKAKNKTVDYTWIDKMETFVVSEAQIKQFVETGGLSPKGGDK